MKNLKPFDLERALAGDLVVTRGGNRVSQLHLFDTPSEFNLYGIKKGDHIASRWSEEGLSASFAENDLFMAPKTVEKWVNIYGCKHGIIETGLNTYN